MAIQKSIKQAEKEKKLELTYWAQRVVERLKANFDTQNIFPYGSPGPYPGSPPSTGDAFRSIYAKVYNAAGGNTEKVSSLTDTAGFAHHRKVWGRSVWLYS